MTPAGSPATPEPQHAPHTESDDATPPVPDAFAAFRANARKRRVPGTTAADGGRPLDWVDPDPSAAAALPIHRHPVHRTVARHKEGCSRSNIQNRVILTHRRLVSLDPAVGSSTDPYDYPWHQLTPELAREYREDVYRQYSKQSTRNDYISMVRQILGQCHRVGLTSALRRDEVLDELYTIAPGPSTKRRRLSHSEVEALLAACENLSNPTLGARDSAIIAVLRTSGMRVGELVKLELADWLREEGILRLRDTKNGRAHDVMVHSVTATYLERWVAKRGSAAGALFTPTLGAHQHRSLDTNTVRYRLALISDLAGVAPFGPHDFRRTLATELLRKHDIALVGRLLNHTKFSSTLIYDLAPEEEQRSAVEGLTLPTADSRSTPEAANPAAADGTSEQTSPEQKSPESPADDPRGAA